MDIEAELVRLFGLRSVSEVCQGGETFGQGGYLSFRRAITISKEGSQPLEVFIKCSDVSRQELDFLQVISNFFCRTECLFYGLMAPVLKRVMRQYEIEPVFPKAFGQRISAKGTILVMEDLTKLGFSPVDRHTYGMEKIYCAVKSLARVQAAYWIARTSFNGSLDPMLFGPGSPFSQSIKNSGVDFKPLMERNVAYFMEHLSERVKSADDATTLLDCVNKFVKNFVEDVGSYLPSDQGRPTGLSHGDPWLSNVMFKGEGEAMTCRIFDWQFWEVGLFGVDLGLFMVTSLSTEMFREHLERIPATYYQTFKDIYEAKTGNPAPFTEEAAAGNMRDALFYALFWVLATGEILWPTNHLDVAEVLANLAFAIRTDRMAVPTG